MITKICTKCKKEKLIAEFSKGTDKNGLNYYCKECISESGKIYREKNSEQIKEIQKRAHKKYSKRIKEYRRKYYEKNKEKIKQKVRKWYKNNTEEARKVNKIYRKNHKKERNILEKIKFKTNPDYRLNHNITVMIHHSLKGNKKGRHWESLVGYTLENLKQHLEFQFKEGMTWKNYGKWHLDHKIPVSLFNIKNVKSKGFKKCWALENLQPLWKSENVKKGNKLFY